MSQRSEAASSGVGLSGLVFIVFLVMKLTGIGAVAHWSWWWVTAPLWGPFAFVVAMLPLFLMGAGIAALLDLRDERRRAAMRVGQGGKR